MLGKITGIQSSYVSYLPYHKADVNYLKTLEYYFDDSGFLWGECLPDNFVDSSKLVSDVFDEGAAKSEEEIT